MGNRSFHKRDLSSLHKNIMHEEEMLDRIQEEKPKSNKKSIKFNINKSQAIVMMVLVFVGIFAFVLNTSYAYFTTQSNTDDYIVYTGGLQIDFTKNSNVFNLSKSYPMSNPDGLEATDNTYSFSVTNNGTVKAKYRVRLELLSDENSLPLMYVKMAYTTDGVNYSEPIRLSELSSNLVFIESKELETTNTDSYTLKFWIDYSTPQEMAGKHFTTQIVVDAIQSFDGDFNDVDSEPTVVLNTGENGKIEQIITVGDTFVDPGVASIIDDKDTLDKNNIVKTYKYFNGVETVNVSDINTSVNGIYYIVYAIADSNNNIGSAERVVTVVSPPDTPGIPTITLLGDNPQTVYKDSTYVEQGYTVAEGNTVRILGTVNNGTSGTYELTYVVMDTNNTNYATRTVIVRGRLLSDMILAENEIITTPLTSTELQTADANDNTGKIYKMSVTNGYGGTTETADTYFFRGDVTNNVVEFAGKIWRIVRINEDGTIRLILDTATSTTANYFNNTSSSYTYTYYSNSTSIGNSTYPNAKYSIDKWYQENIKGTNTNKVAIGNYFCETANVRYNTNYKQGSAVMDVYGSYIPDLSCEAYYCNGTQVLKSNYDSCSGTKEIRTTDGNGKGYVSGQVGLITYDEVIFAGGKRGATNQSFYLYKTASGGTNNYAWWTMSPAGYYSSNGNTWRVTNSGNLDYNRVSYSAYLRPVINLKASVTATKDTTTGHYIVD